MATEPDATWINRSFPIEPGNRKEFGVISEARVADPGISAFFIIKCSDGTTVEDEFVYSLNPCLAVGGLVVLELTPGNKVGARRFKAIDDMLAAHKAKLEAEQRQKQSSEKRRRTIADKSRSGDATKAVATSATRMTVSCPCAQGKIKLDMAMDAGGGSFEAIDFSALHLIATKVKLEIIPAVRKRARLAISLSAADVVKLIGGKQPCTETFDSIYLAICVKKGMRPPTDTPAG